MDASEALALANRKTIIRIIYCLFAENILDNQSIRFSIIPDEANSPIYLTNEQDAFKFIYLKQTLSKYQILCHSKNNDRSFQIRTAEQMLNDIVSPMCPKQNLKNAQNEIKSSIQNESKSLITAQQTFNEMVSTHPEYQNVCDWITKLNKANPLYFDQIITKLSSFCGHRFHPMTKTKLRVNDKQNLSDDKLKSYLPENNQIIPIFVAALHRKYAKCEDILCIDNEKNTIVSHKYFEKHFESQYKQMCEQLVAMKHNPFDFVPIPFHPLQLAHIKQIYADLIAEEALILFENVSIDSIATMSFRTMAPFRSASRPHMKLPINIQATSEIRYHPSIANKNFPLVSLYH